MTNVRKNKGGEGKPVSGGVREKGQVYRLLRVELAEGVKRVKWALIG